MDDVWKNDLLGHQEIAETFTRLVQSIDPEREASSKVISIEAGFGWGFRPIRPMGATPRFPRNVPRS